jgi:hypothetical protein
MSGGEAGPGNLDRSRRRRHSSVVGIEHKERGTGDGTGNKLGHEVHPQRRPGEHPHHHRTEGNRRVERTPEMSPTANAPAITVNPIAKP